MAATATTSYVRVPWLAIVAAAMAIAELNPHHRGQVRAHLSPATTMESPCLMDFWLY
jgi:hypothetical protein